MRGKVAKCLRKITKFDPHMDRNYFHFNAEKNRKKIKADKFDPIISDATRQIYNSAKDAYRNGLSLLQIQNQLWAAANEAKSL